ncbi:helix-turn-helix domain-containing protein [Cellulomonas iranensis]|uniref:helix-turn-helix domain-containing protein n=1 Tax=Cellulomonas iranensis TaxID=76862 RepID=UPI001F09840F|nr:helix-turn-helix domain-containing protein [Cellulomonas iranensis]
MEPRAVTLTPMDRHPSSWRRTIGALLRAAREERALRLVDVAARARLSPQYLSEVERGRKEPSSEVLAALTDALGLTLVDLAHGIAAALGADTTASRDRVRAGDRASGRRAIDGRARDGRVHGGPLDAPTPGDRRGAEQGALVPHRPVVDLTAPVPAEGPHVVPGHVAPGLGVAGLGLSGVGVVDGPVDGGLVLLAA